MRRYNPNDASDRKKLFTSIEQSSADLREFRSTRMTHLEMFVGHNYGKNLRKRTYLNLLYEAVTVYSRHLAARNPTCLVVTPQAHLRGVAKDMQAALNHQMREINFGQTLQLVVLEAMFSMGVAKMGVTPEEREGVKGYLHDANQTFVDPVSFDKFFYDSSSESLESADYMGDVYQLPTDYIQRSRMFNRKSRHMAKSAQKDGQFPQGQGRSGQLSGSQSRTKESLKKRTWLYDVWLPAENLLVTLLKDQPAAPPLRVVEWEGPERGPYHTLGFTKVPGNIQPLPPAVLWSDLHELTNSLLRKLANQARRQKTITLTSDEEDAESINRTDDGNAVDVDNFDSVMERTFGGVSGNNLNFMQGCRELFSRSAGNLEILGGYGADSETLGQDRLLNANANERVRDMQDEVVLFIQRVVQEMAWYLWDDPLVSIPITRTVGNEEIHDVWTPASREGDFFDYNFSIEPHSLRSMSPQERLLQLRGAMGNFIMPAMESLAQQGYGLDANEYISVVAELSGIHELKRIITPLDGDVQERPGNPHTGDHVYTRVDSGPPRQPQTDPAGQAFSSVTDTTQNT
jgi:hypothetical protein